VKKLHYTITIDAPREQVWQTMLDKSTYEEWTAVFNPSGGSTYEGGWEQGSAIDFIGSDKGGKVGGMYAEIAENRPNEFLSIHHLGEIADGERRPAPQEEEAYENYTFEDDGAGTKLTVDLDTKDEYADMFDDMWPKALEKLKELAERN
jgi:uncharacterized protein YndB with AHSA1/START domain